MLDSWTTPKASHGKGIQQILFRKQSVPPPVSPSAFAGSSVSWQGTGSQLHAGTGSLLETVSPSQHHQMRPKVKGQTNLKNSVFFPVTSREIWAWRKPSALCCPGATCAKLLSSLFKASWSHPLAGWETLELRTQFSKHPDLPGSKDRLAFASQCSWAHVPHKFLFL